MVPQANGISYSAYSPLGGLSGINVFNNPTVKSVAKAHNVYAATLRRFLPRFHGWASECTLGLNLRAWLL